MKKRKLITTSILTAMMVVPVLSGCNLFKRKKPADDNPGQQEGMSKIDFSIAIESGRNQFEIGVPEKLVLLGDGINEEGRSFSYESSDPTVASVDSNGRITPLKEGSVSFQATEVASDSRAELRSKVDVVSAASKASGGFNYSAVNDIATRTKILGKLEKYVMDSHLTGITLFDNGGYVKYNPRVVLPTDNYITGYGFGLLREGKIDTDQDTIDDSTGYRNFYHTSFSQDPGTINAMNDSGSQVSDLYGYVTSTYFGTRMASNKREYEWYPVLAKDKVRKPIINSSGAITGFEASETAQNRPIPLQAHNDLGLYNKWRIYVRTGAGYEYRYNGSDPAIAAAFDHREIAIEDYEYIYKFLLTGVHGMSRGSEMASDDTYGIKGAFKYNQDTLTEENQTIIDNTWNGMQDRDELGIHTGNDVNGDYIDIELINPIDEFTAMYTLSSNLVSPLPEAFFKAIGEGGSIIGTGDHSNGGAYRYGNFNNGSILNYMLSVGPYMLTAWNREVQIAFSRNNGWYEVGPNTYQIEGIHERQIDTSEDPEAVYAAFNNHMVDVCGIPTTKVDIEKNAENVYPTKGDSTFKLNVNSCTQDQWDALFGPNNKYQRKPSTWDVKEWMSNDNFLDGLFSSINRKQFAEKRGVQPSINYFSDAYLSDPEHGVSYNSTPEHKEAVKSYHSVGADGVDNFGYDYGRAVKSFRAAVNELALSGAITKGSKDDPYIMDIDICWMYQTDVQEYGADIKNYFESAFNDDAVCGGTVKLKVSNSYVSKWQDVYDEKMMKGQFDLAFGAISGNTYNPLNFLEVLKTDNSSTFTLNWGEDTAELSEKNPIYYNGKKWSFDALWSCADHGGIARDGVKVEPVQRCYKDKFTWGIGGDATNQLYTPGKGGIKIDIPLVFEETANVSYDVTRVVVTARGGVNVNATFTREGNVLHVSLSEATCQSISNDIYNGVFKDEDTSLPENAWMLNPFLASKYNDLWSFGVYYKLTIGDSQPTENYVAVKADETVK